MFRTSFSALVCLLQATLFSCGHQDQEMKSHTSSIVQAQSSNRNFASEYAGSIGRLEFKGQLYCAAFAIEKDKVATAAHCLSKDPSELENTFYVNAKLSKIRIVRVVSNLENSDYAVLELAEEPNLKPFLTGELRANAKVSLWRSSPYLRANEIQSAEGDVEVQTSEYSSFYHMANTSPGDSGSPLIQGGKVVGMHIGSNLNLTKNMGALLQNTQGRPLKFLDLKKENFWAAVGSAVGGWVVGKALDAAADAFGSWTGGGKSGSTSGNKECTPAPTSSPSPSPTPAKMACLFGSFDTDAQTGAILDFRLKFDPLYYAARYSDLQAAFGSDTSALSAHFSNDGLREGRRPSFFIDPKYYLNRYSDLKSTFGADNYAAAYDHWINYGIKEGRQGSADFNVRAYLDHSPDLQAAFGDNFGLAMRHFLTNGISEQRNGL
jgi:hypothetical protein